MRGKTLSLLFVPLWTLAGPAQADLSISNKPTHDMSCDAGVCTATAKGANLNVGDPGDLGQQSEHQQRLSLYAR